MPNFKLTHSPLSQNLVVNSEEGKRIHPNSKKLHTHTGIDLKASMNTLVCATHSGRVIKTSEIGGAGKTIAIYNETTGLLTLYEHLSDYDVIKGNIITEDQVKNGFVIGKSGNAGGALEPHLHFEVLDGKQLVEGYENNKKATYPIWQWIEEKAGSNNLGITSSVPRLNPRPYLADLAISETISSLALAGDLNYYATDLTTLKPRLKTDSELDDDQRKEVYTKSCFIFPCELITDQYGRELQGDKRANILSLKSRDPINKPLYKSPNNYENIFTFNGSESNDIYEIPSNFFGQINISDSKENSKLILDGKEITAPAIAIKNQNTGEIIKNSWLLKHTTSNNAEKQYLLQRINSKGSNTDNKNLSDSGTDLLITPLHQVISQNYIEINQFSNDNNKRILKSFKTAIVSILVLLLTSAVTIDEVNAVEVKNQDQAIANKSLKTSNEPKLLFQDVISKIARETEVQRIDRLKKEYQLPANLNNLNGLKESEIKAILIHGTNAIANQNLSTDATKLKTISQNYVKDIIQNSSKYSQELREFIYNPDLLLGIVMQGNDKQIVEWSNIYNLIKNKEQRINRLKKEYPIGWFKKRYGSWTDCEATGGDSEIYGYNDEDFKKYCETPSDYSGLNEKQINDSEIKSVIIHGSNLIDDGYGNGSKFSDLSKFYIKDVITTPNEYSKEVRQILYNPDVLLGIMLANAETVNNLEAFYHEYYKAYKTRNHN